MCIRDSRSIVVGGTIVAMIVGLFCDLSFGALADFKIFGKTVFDLLDYLTSNVGMPLSALGFLIAAAWVAWKNYTAHQLQTVKPLSALQLNTIRFFMGILAPLMIVIVVATNI